MELPEIDDPHRRTFTAEAEAYNAWANTIPRPKPIQDRYRELIRLDAEYEITEATLEAGGRTNAEAIADAIEADAVEAGAARVSAMQIRRRCSSAVQDARANGADKAAEQLTEIKNIADALLETE